MNLKKLLSIPLLLALCLLVGLLPVLPGAAALERMETPERKSKFLCPHCKEGSLRFVRGKNGGFWGCSNYPSCTATYDDANGKPALP